MVHRTLVLAALALPTTLVAAAPTPASTPPAHCASTSIGGSFTSVSGSAGAGSISYALRLHNHGSAPCGLPREPRLRLLDAAGKALPTHAGYSPHEGGVRTLSAGHTAIATGRFSPDVPSGNEGNPCERTAHHLRVQLHSGSVVVPIHPATSVCEHGGIAMGPLKPE